MNTTQKFWCPLNGHIGNENVEIDIPTHCPTCNVPLHISAYGGKPSCFDAFGWNTCCSNAFGRYDTIWEQRVIVPATPTYPNGVVCTKCNARNFYGIPNRPDGSYVCFECK